jgi:hypothetical protein
MPTMTIAVAAKTASAVVFAADSKTMTKGFVGMEQDGKPRFVDQTYDNATKVVHDRSKTMMAMVAGSANIGRVTATDFISTRTFPPVIGETAADQDRRLSTLVAEMVAQKRSYWETTKVPPDQWPGPSLTIAAVGSSENVPRVWLVNLEGAESTIEETLQQPGIRLDGTYPSSFSLLYGYEPSVLVALGAELGVDEARAWEATEQLKVPRPVETLNLSAMPIQDAIDLAVFVAHVEIQMQRFLPGNAVCGGPIDVMVLQTAPEPAILTFPGKTLHHPGRERRMGS